MNGLKGYGTSLLIGVVLALSSFIYFQTVKNLEGQSAVLSLQIASLTNGLRDVGRKVEVLDARTPVEIASLNLRLSRMESALERIEQRLAGR